MELTGLLYDPNRHGRPRWYVRVRGRKRRIEGVDCPPPYPSTKAAHAAYWAAREALGAGAKPLPGKGSLRWLVETYTRSRTFERLNPLTRAERISVLGRIVATHGTKPFALMQPQHVVKVRDELDGVPANKRVKCLRYLFKWACSEGLSENNPAKDVELLRVGSTGWTPWTPEDVLAFEARHPVSSKARLALALFLYTGQRKSDVVQWGDLNVRAERLIYVQHKGRGRKPKRRNIPLVAPLREILDASPRGATTWLETEQGQPFSIAGFGNKMRQWCDEAGLVGLSSHGIRKAVGIMAAERGCTAHQIMEILGHDTLDEAERYTRQANAVRIGDEGFRRVWGTEHE